MKKYCILLLIIVIASSCKAQTILPVENYINYINSGNGLPSNVEKVKDINGVLNEFIGEWQGSYNNNNYEVKIYKETVNEVTGIEKDLLKMKYKIIDQSNNIIFNTYLTSNSGYIPKGHYYLSDSGRYGFFYQGEDFLCGQGGEIFIEMNTITQMKLILVPSRDVIYDCPDGEAEQIFPTDNWMTLTRTAF